ncbi:DUF4249 family protein [Portibacter lacus]|uniref:DUF4249 family protein n=1 Tax=Portibacter lacus TaxID=1099794 RepID=UPI001F1F880F|nr:DUF4249 family protein [Portibacter lacus]
MKRLTIFLFALLLFSSCEQDAFFTVPDGDSKLFAFSEISTKEKVKVFVNTAVGINTDDSFIYPKQSDAEVILMIDGVALEDPGFRYISSEGAFVSQGAFRPEAGINYGLKVILSENNRINPILGNTMIPIPDTLKVVKVKSLKEQFLAYNMKDFVASFNIGFDDMENGLYILRAYFDNNGVKENLLVRDINQEGEGAYISNYNKGVLINKDKLTDELTIEFTNRKNVDGDLLIDEIQFELLSITSDAYNYYKSFAKQVASQSAGIAEPVISYTNFENGLGLFTGYSSTELTVSVN